MFQDKDNDFGNFSEGKKKGERREKEGRKKGKTVKRLNALVGTMNNNFC
jgi:hypothetical protein